MTKKSIFTVHVKVIDQPQADRLKAVCLEFGLPIWEFEDAFKFDDNGMFLCFCANNVNIAIYGNHWNRTEVLETEFLALCEEWKKENKN